MIPITNKMTTKKSTGSSHRNTITGSVTIDEAEAGGNRRLESRDQQRHHPYLGSRRPRTEESIVVRPNGIREVPADQIWRLVYQEDD